MRLLSVLVFGVLLAGCTTAAPLRSAQAFVVMPEGEPARLMEIYDLTSEDRTTEYDGFAFDDGLADDTRICFGPEIVENTDARLRRIRYKACMELGELRDYVVKQAR